MEATTILLILMWLGIRIGLGLFFKKAEIYLAQNKPEAGLKAIKEAINLVQNNKYYYVLGAQLEKVNRNMEGAAQFYELMVKQTTDFQAYLVELATTYQAIGKTKDAIHVFEKQPNLSLDQNMKLVEMYVQESKEKNAVQLMETLFIQQILFSWKNLQNNQ